MTIGVIVQLLTVLVMLAIVGFAFILINEQKKRLDAYVEDSAAFLRRFVARNDEYLNYHIHHMIQHGGMAPAELHEYVRAILGLITTHSSKEQWERDLLAAELVCGVSTLQRLVSYAITAKDVPLAEILYGLFDQMPVRTLAASVTNAQKAEILRLTGR